MNQEILFWIMSALLLIVPFGMILVMPKSRIREILLRCFVGIIFLAMGGSILLTFVPQEVLHPHLFSTATFWILTALLIIVPIALILLMPSSRFKTILINGLLWLFGAISLILGIIGVFLPVIPTVPFILLTAACWGRASPKFHAWLSNHKYFGPMVKNWEERRAVPRRAKYLAWSMMTLSCTWLFIQFPQRWYVGASTAAVCLCVGLWMKSLPDA